MNKALANLNRHKYAEQTSNQNNKESRPGMITTLIEFAKNNAVSAAVSFVVSGLVSSYIGYRFAIKRDRRKEINEVADRLYAALELEVQHRIPSVKNSDITAFRRRAGWLQRRKFDRALRQYRHAHEKNPPTQDEMGGLIYPYPDEVHQAAQKLLKACSRI